MLNKIAGTELDEDFYINTSYQRMGFVKLSNKEYGSEFMGRLYHIRNCFAHGRYGIVSLPNNDYMLFLEDEDRVEGNFEVNGRFTVKISSLVAIKGIITNGPDRDPDYREEIIESI